MGKRRIKKGVCIFLTGILVGICISFLVGKSAMLRRFFEVREYMDNRDKMINYGLGLSDELPLIYKSKLSEEQIVSADNKIEQCILQQGWINLDEKSAVDEVYEYVYALEYDEEEHRKTAYETICFEKGDCLGKADLFCEFMDRLGIESFIIPIYPDGSMKVLQILSEETWDAYTKKGHAINGVIIEDECYLIDCCNGEFMFEGIYGEDGYVKKRLITMHEYYHTFESNIQFVEGDELYHFKYRIMPQIEEEIIMLLQNK